MEPGPAHKHRRLDGTNSQGIWKPRYMLTIELNVNTPRHNPLSIKSLLKIHKDDLAHATMRPAVAQLSSDHQDVAGSMEAVIKLRNSLPELLSYRTVLFDVANNYWVVDVGYTNPGCRTINLPLKIGRCPVYLFNSRELYEIQGLYADNFDPICPLQICSDRQLCQVAESFPHSIGMRVHKWGHVEILFESNKKVRQGLRDGMIPGSIGGLTWGTRVLEIDASASNVCAGMQVAKKEEEYMNVLGCIGLRIRQKDEEKDSWTTTTHAWMSLPSGTLSRPKNLITNLAILIRRNRILSATMDILRGPEAEGRRSQSVLGTNVFIAGTRVKVGTITKCYDPLPLPDSTLAFPLGLDYDLSLITGDSLPTMSMPPNFPIVESTFADPDEALKAPDLFLSHFNVRYDRWNSFTGHVVTGHAREALVVGMDYFWKTRHVKAKRALIWRTEIDDDSVAGASGSTLCLGKPSALTCKPVLFQNYETGFQKNKFWATDRVRSHITGGMGAARATFKGGFLLPADVRTAEIIVDDSPKRRSASGPEAASSAYSAAAEKKNRNHSDNL